MPDDRIIGRKAIIQFMNRFIGCTSWNTIRNQVKYNDLPIDWTPGPNGQKGKPFVVPAKVQKWDRIKREEAAAKAAKAAQN